MKLKFKVQEYQTRAVAAVADCFLGQPFQNGLQYRVDPGVSQGRQIVHAAFEEGFRNADIALSREQLLKNIQAVQRSQNLEPSTSLNETVASGINLDIEMETGTGKTYCYIKTIFELNQRYGWSKFVIVVPSIAIREGVYKSLSITADHFQEGYAKKARFFIYNSRSLHDLESFSSGSSIQVMVINIQAFNATGKDNRRIYDELDDFQSRRPIDVLSANRPILILDEPQKMEGDGKKEDTKTGQALAKFKPLFILRYSATHKRQHDKVYRLDALDAFNQKLVKKISVRGITVKGLSGTGAYLYLDSIELSTGAPEARLEMEIRGVNRIKREIRRVNKGTNLFELSNELEEYQDFVVSDIDARTGEVHFTNGVVVTSGESIGDTTEANLRRIQIREAIKAHLEKERALFSRGIKVLTLFFIDEVAKYRDYTQPDERGDYARLFEEEYQACLLGQGLLLEPDYAAFLERDPVTKIHDGYFAIDKKSKRLVDPSTGARSDDTDDADAYDLILKNKERLLSRGEPVRFLFSHSALREGWDNPNVFVICTLKHGKNDISRRQEVGRGLRLSVDQSGDRMDHPSTVHQVNVLTVVTSESYTDFVTALQKDIRESLSQRPRHATAAYFTGKVIHTDDGDLTVTPELANQLHRYLIKHDFVDQADAITQTYHEARERGDLPTLPPDLQPHAPGVIALIDSVFRDGMMPGITNERVPKVVNRANKNFERAEFQELWQRINHRSVYAVDFDSDELVKKAVRALERELHVSPLQYLVEHGTQADQATLDTLEANTAFVAGERRTDFVKDTIRSQVRYDLVGKLAEATQLRRETTARILTSIAGPVFAQFKTNPEDFLSKASRIVNEQKATVIVEHIAYHPREGRYDSKIFTDDKRDAEVGRAFKAQRHILDYVFTDSDVERKFVEELDCAAEVVVYAKLPKGFFIPTPVGDYTPDWAVAFQANMVKHVFFVAETKGDLSSLQLREVERAKIECARKFFAKITEDKVKYDVVNSYAKLRELVG